MKNIFKFMGIALMACSLTVACGDKDNESDDPQNPINPENPIADGVSVTFNGESWTPGDIQTVNHAGQNGTLLIADYFATADSYFPGFEMYTYQQAVGSETSTAASTGALSSQSGPVICEYYQEMILRDQNGSAYGDWWAKSITCNIAAFDLSAMKTSFTVAAEMFSAADAFVDQFQDADGNATDNPNYTNGDINAARQATLAVSAGNVDIVAE